jgi:D-serine deaminase-like pyridoxal phosphate-dependent protein
MPSNDAEWFKLANAVEVPSPSLLIYVERASENIRRMIAIAGGPERLRPHIKTHKMPALIERQLRAGVQKFKCATIAEAEMCAAAGAPDVLLAMQPVGPNIGRLIRLIGAFPRTKFSTILDDGEIALQLSAAANAASLKVDVLLDIDCGMHRCGIAPGPAAIGLYQHIASLPGLRAAGFHAYDGHIHDSDLSERTRRCDEAFAPIEKLATDLRAGGLAVDIIVAGGTPTFPIHARRKGVECSPGTCVLSDVGYAKKFPDLDFLVAACVLTRVVSKPGPNLICVELGHKSVASENPHPRAEFPQLPDAHTVTHSEEHLVLETPLASSLEAGHALYAFPKHICPTVALYSEAVTVVDHVAGERWPVTARNRIITL